ncbi:MAG: arginase family protein, partial [Nanoarchaeota archaeon]
KRAEKEPCLIVFDAHFDSATSESAGKSRRWVREIVEKGFPARNILIVGARKFEIMEKEFILKGGIRQMMLNKIRENIGEMTDTIMEFAYNKELYVSVDFDVIDPAFAPAVVCGEPGGLTSRDILYMLGRISLMKNLKAMDIVEIDAEKDRTGMTIKLGAKVLAEVL